MAPNHSPDALTHAERRHSEMKPDVASRYIRENFYPDDRLALVLLNKHSGAVVQRIASAEKFASEDIERWLARKNREGFEVYVGMNALRDNAHSRTKGDIGEIRHVYLDLDEQAEDALKALRERDPAT